MRSRKWFSVCGFELNQGLRGFIAGVKTPAKPRYGTQVIDIDWKTSSDEESEKGSAKRPEGRDLTQLRLSTGASCEGVHAESISAVKDGGFW